MNKTTLLLAVILLPFLINAKTPQQLKFNKDGKFKIVQFTDIHWKPNNPASEEAAVCMSAILDSEKPDLVIYTGDLAFAPPAREAVLKSLAPVLNRNIPFAVTWGNHDDEHDATREELFALIENLPGNMTDSVPGLSGVTNFLIPINGSVLNKPMAMLYVFDSNSYSNVEKAKGYAGIQLDQVNWYSNTSKQITKENGGQPLPSLAFFHVPLNEMAIATTDETALMMGTRREKSCPGSLNSGLFSEIAHREDIMATMTGHDHVNDYAVLYKGILLANGRYTGGKTVYCDIPGGNGARVIEMIEGQRSFNSWIRLHNGDIINYFSFPHDFSRWKETATE